MEILNEWLNRCLGRNEGIELIAQRLRNGTPRVKAYDISDNAIIHFRGTGKYLSGWGNKRVYDIQFQLLNHRETYRETLTEWAPVSESVWMRAHLDDLDDSDFRDLRDQEGENDPEEVIAWLGKIASRLKPHQFYSLNSMNVSNSLFAGDNIRLYSGKQEVLIPREYISSRRLIGGSELGTAFDPKRVGILDEKKIARIHRKNDDPKRWFELKKVESVNDKHAIRFTHRKTANAPVHYYALEIIADSKAMAGHPFYVEELLSTAVSSLQHSASNYSLEINTSAIDFTWDNKTVSIDVYRDNQSKYPASVDLQPLLIYPELVVKHYVGYPSDQGWYICTKASVETEKANREKACCNCKGSR